MEFKRLYFNSKMIFVTENSDCFYLYVNDGNFIVYTKYEKTNDYSSEHFKISEIFDMSNLLFVEKSEPDEVLPVQPDEIEDDFTDEEDLTEDNVDPNKNNPENDDDKESYGIKEGNEMYSNPYQDGEDIE